VFGPVIELLGRPTMFKKPIPLWPILLAGAYLLFLIYGAVQHQRRREAKKREILEQYFPALVNPIEK
jgi:hypothetical protein